jgi:ornithine carbamoyltransferase
MLKQPYPWSLDSLNREGLLALIGSASRLTRAAAGGAVLPQLLRGKKLALLSDDHAAPAAAAFLRAATELGAHVAHVRASNPGEAGRRDPRDMAALLGQLYDAIECQGLPEAELRQLGRDAGVPVFDGIGHPAHPLHLVADLMTLSELDGGRPLDELRVAYRGDAAGLRAFARICELLGITPTEGGSTLPLTPASPAVAELQARHCHHLLQALLSAALA